MSLATLSFKLYTDSGLTSSFSGALSLLHATSLSDNPQTFTLYFGSAEAEDSRLLEAVSNPGVDQITLTPTSIISEWAVATAYTLGQQVEPTTPNTYYYEVTTAGTSHATTEPTWPTTPLGATVSDGTVTWTLKAKKHPTTEITLSLDSGFSGAVAGAAIDLGTSLSSGTANAIPVYIKIINTVATVSDDTGYPQLDIYINNVRETSA